MHPNNESHILLFDGVCNLCIGIVNFIIKRDSKKKFKFAALQSEKGQTLLKKGGFSTTDINTFVYISEDHFFVKSSAILQVLKDLGGVWKLFYVFILIPVPVRDFIYSLITKIRYRLFGKRDTCMVPTSEINKYFLN